MNMLSKLTKQLQEHPIIVLAMFFLSLLSALVTLILGWQDLYADYLSKSLELPVWLVFLLAILGFVGWVLVRPSEVGKGPLKRIQGETYGVQRVVLDGKEFRQCRFSASELVIEGKAGFSLAHNEFESPRFTFSGPANTTIVILTEMYKDPAFRSLVDGALENIKAGVIPQSAPLNPNA
jgi:4-amino-4-deoxy-L-arabinose transferase-like glycosyltransferase